MRAAPVQERVAHRTLTPRYCADYSKMFELTDSLGRKLFESISITLVCEDCMQTDHPEKCAIACPCGEPH